MRELPFDIDADAVIEVGRYLDDHAKTTAVSIYEALRVIRRRVNNSRVGRNVGLGILIGLAGIGTLFVIAVARVHP